MTQGTPQDESVRYERRAAVAVVTMNRPEQSTDS